MTMKLYGQYYAIHPESHPFYLLRENRDVIKMGAYRLWDNAPGPGCPVVDRFYRRIGLRVFTAVKGEE